MGPSFTTAINVNHTFFPFLALSTGRLTLRPASNRPCLNRNIPAWQQRTRCHIFLTLQIQRQQEASAARVHAKSSRSTPVWSAMHTFCLFDRFVSEHNFHLAWQRVAAKNKAGGIDSVSVASFARSAETLLSRLRKSVIDGTYEPLPARSVYIPKFLLSQYSVGFALSQVPAE